MTGPPRPSTALLAASAFRRASDLFLEASLALEAGLDTVGHETAARALVVAKQVDRLHESSQLALPLGYASEPWRSTRDPAR